MADPGPPALGADGLLGREVVSEGVEELVRHLGAGHGSSLPEWKKATVPWRKTHAGQGFCQSL
jgi:hypothetical protein